MKEESKFLEKWRKTNSIVGFILSFISGTIVLAVVMTFDFLKMLFASGEDGTRYCFFKTIFFKLVTDMDETSTMSFGFTGEYIPILIIWGSLCFFFFGTFYLSKVLLTYRHNLIEIRKSGM